MKKYLRAAMNSPGAWKMKPKDAMSLQGHARYAEEGRRVYKSKLKEVVMIYDGNISWVDVVMQMFRYLSVISRE